MHLWWWLFFDVLDGIFVMKFLEALDDISWWYSWLTFNVFREWCAWWCIRWFRTIIMMLDDAYFAMTIWCFVDWWFCCWCIYIYMYIYVNLMMLVIELLLFSLTWLIIYYYYWMCISPLLLELSPCGQVQISKASRMLAQVS